MPLTTPQLRDLDAPPGWEWESKPSLRVLGRIKAPTPSRHTIVHSLGVLAAWAIKHDLGLSASDVTPLGPYGATYWTSFKVKANAPARTRVIFDDFKCWNCGTNCPPGTTGCKYCGMTYVCNGCNVYGLKPYFPTPDKHTAYCGKCTKRCATDNCKNRTVEGTEKCLVCEPMVRCSVCGGYHAKSATNREVWPGGMVCTPCVTKQTCPKCEKFSPHGVVASFEGTKMCETCVREVEDMRRRKHEVIEADQMPVSGTLLIENNPHRPYRSVSIELELNGDKEQLGGVLYRCGMIHRPVVESYHAYPDIESPFVGFLKHDGTVSGGELILSLLRLDTEEHAGAFLDVLKVLNSLKAIKKVSCDAVCSNHIHIDAHNFPHGDAWRLLTVYNYLEDVIYRIAAGDAPYGHRSLTREAARVAEQYGHPEGYMAPTLKGPFGTKSAFGRSLTKMNRTTGLNFQPWLKARANCTCGAYLAEESRNCTCNLGKATVEWRVFNSTLNPRILHAWIALVEAMMAFATDDSDPDAVWEKQYPPFPWVKMAFDKTGVAHRITTKERLEWIFRNLMFTIEERDSLVYTLKQTDLALLGEEYLDGLLLIKPEKEFMVKREARNPARRRRKIKIAPPAPGQIPAKKKRGTGISYAEFVAQTNASFLNNAPPMPSIPLNNSPYE